MGDVGARRHAGEGRRAGVAEEVEHPDGAAGAADAGGGGGAASGVDGGADARGPRVARRGCGCDLASGDVGPWTVALFALGAAAARGRASTGSAPFLIWRAPRGS